MFQDLVCDSISLQILSTALFKIASLRCLYLEKIIAWKIMTLVNCIGVGW